MCPCLRIVSFGLTVEEHSFSAADSLEAHDDQDSGTCLNLPYLGLLLSQLGSRRSDKPIL